MTTMEIAVTVATDMYEGRTHAKVVLDTDDISALVNMGIDSIAGLVKDAEKRSTYKLGMKEERKMEE